MPASVSALLLKPWTIISYMFLHQDFFHLFFNMLMLYWSGKIFLEYLGNKKFISTYILGGLAGAALFIIAFNIFPVFNSHKHFAYAMGASASVLAVLVAIATFLPNYSIHLLFIGAVRFQYIALFMVVVDILSIEKGNPGGHIAHLGGALYGFIYIKLMQQGRDISAWFDKLINFFATLFKPKSKLKIAYKRTMNDDDYNTNKILKQKKIDEILDKISTSGYESLSKQEKELLFNMSKNI